MRSFSSRRFIALFLFAVIALSPISALRSAEAADPTLDERVALLEKQVQTLITVAQIQLKQIQGLQSQNQVLSSRVQTLETDGQKMAATLACMSKEWNEVFFTGCNVNIRNGLNKTESLNGLGNLIVGYNEQQPDSTLPLYDRSGSHNLGVGPQHTYSSMGGFVAGLANTIGSRYTSVSGG